MAGIMNKIGDALHMGGKKEEDKPKYPVEHKQQYSEEQHKHKEGEQKVGFMDKIKEKIPGAGGAHQEGKIKDGGKKKKKEKKKHEDGHEHGHSSSSSDSD